MNIVERFREILEGYSEARKRFLDELRAKWPPIPPISSAEDDVTAADRSLWVTFVTRTWEEKDQSKVDSSLDQFKELKSRNLIVGTEGDIDRYKKFEDLENFVKTASLRKSKTQQKKEARVKGADLVFSNDVWNVYRITTKEASVLYGANTKWCTTSTKGPNEPAFRGYMEKQVALYYMISKDPKVVRPMKKVGILISPDGAAFGFNEIDEGLDLQVVNVVEEPGETILGVPADVFEPVDMTRKDNFMKFIDRKYDLNSGYVFWENGKLNSDGVTINIPEFPLRKLPVPFGVIKHANFFVDSCRLVTLENCPEEVDGSFSCNNNDLEDLVGAPWIVKGDFSAMKNSLTSLAGFPIRVETLSLLDNPKKFTREDVHAAQVESAKRYEEITGKKIEPSH